VRSSQIESRSGLRRQHNPVTFTSGNPDLTRSIRIESDEFKKKPFSINGRYLGDKLPKKVDIKGIGDRTSPPVTTMGVTGVTGYLLPLSRAIP